MYDFYGTSDLDTELEVRLSVCWRNAFVDCFYCYSSTGIWTPLDKKAQWQYRHVIRVGTLYGLAIVPVILFLMNGILLRHYALIAASLLFGACHLMVVQENQS